ncbi:196_t:CDS:2 [Diversispora eburnea]|uniref:196_t:CDS:1 n=1 Tax=Diversispora eburnea TaxID=1213867 RepID=A0A9N8WIY6_9GLOM|nr:196_t:CDS:2 [Diversispora eburnea]
MISENDAKKPPSPFKSISRATKPMRPTSLADVRMGDPNDRSHKNTHLHKSKFINCEASNGGTVYNGGAITIDNSVLPKKKRNLEKDGELNTKLTVEIKEFGKKFAKVESENIELKAENIKVKTENTEIKADTSGTVLPSKRTNIFEEDSSKKSFQIKQKTDNREDSPILKKLIKELQSTNSSPQSETNPLQKSKILVYNILKEASESINQNVDVAELPPCSECDKEIFAITFEPLNILTCGHVYHRYYIAKKNLFTEENKCPSGCGKVIEPAFPAKREFSQQSSQSSTLSMIRKMSNQLQINSLVIQENEEMEDAISNKRANETTGESTENTSSKKLRNGLRMRILTY